MRRRIAIAVTCILAVTSAAMADTIYLTNGRVIRTEAARIEGDRVVFRQYGGEVAIPRSAVARIVDDDEVQRSTAPREAPPGAVPSGGVTPAAPAAGASAVSPVTTPTVPATPAMSAASSSPAATVEYWVKRIHEADERIARARSEIERLPYYSPADRELLRTSGQARYFIAERDKWEAMLRRFEATRRQLLEGARKAGVTPGALRDALRR